MLVLSRPLTVSTDQQSNANAVYCAETPTAAPLVPTTSSPFAGPFGGSFGAATTVPSGGSPQSSIVAPTADVANPTQGRGGSPEDVAASNIAARNAANPNSLLTRQSDIVGGNVGGNVDNTKNTGGSGGKSNTGGAGGISDTGGAVGNSNTGGAGGISDTGGAGGKSNTGGAGGISDTGGAVGNPGTGGTTGNTGTLNLLNCLQIQLLPGITIHFAQTLSLAPLTIATVMIGTAVVAGKIKLFPPGCSVQHEQYISAWTCRIRLAWHYCQPRTVEVVYLRPQSR